ncbi:MAG: helix-turn-helix domain-containing protein [Flavobacteriales bacterium]
MKYIIFTDFFIAFNLLLLFAFFFFRKNSGQSNKILALMIGIAFATCICNGFMYLPGYHHFIALNSFLSVIVTFFGPLMLLYIDSVSGKEYRFEKKQLWHLLPALPAFCLTVVLLFASEERKMQEFELIKHSHSLPTNIVYVIVLVQSITYITIAKMRVSKLVKTEQVNSIRKINIAWLNFFVNQTIVLNIVIFSGFVIQSVFWPDHNYVSELLLYPLSAFAFYLVISYKSYSYHSVFDQNNFNLLLEEHKISMGISAETEENTGKVVDENSQLQLQMIKQQLDTLLLVKKIYTDPNLTLQKLADEIKCNKNVLSLTINSLYGKSFYELINGHRVEEAKKLLLDEKKKQYKIESIGEIAGFNSRATFFAIFKKMCNMTPFQFQKMHEKRRTGN